MSRGGRGGGVGRFGGKDFEVDAALEEQVANFTQGDDDDWNKTLYPDVKMPRPPPLTPEMRRQARLQCMLWRQQRESFLFCDPPRNNKRDPADFNAFEDQATYTNKRQKRTTGLPSLKNGLIDPQFLPEELRHVVCDDNEDEETTQARRKKTFDQLQKIRVDKLAKFDDDDDAPAGDDDHDDDGDADDDEPRDDDGIDLPEDDDFSEDDDDLGNDYNAEKYFDDGDGIDDDGGDDGGGEDAW